MPIPQPRDEEERAEFMSRCMGDPTMLSEYAEEGQRFAVCNMQWLNKESEMDARKERKLVPTGETKAMSIDEDNKTLVAVMSTNQVDREGDIVDPRGADVRNFQKNPVLLWGHDSRNPSIGKIVDVMITDESVLGTVQFDKDDPFAMMIFNKYAKGYLNAFSIGFASKTYEMIRDADNDRVTGIHFKEWELHELSAVTVPANADALVREMKGQDKQTVERFVKGVKVEGGDHEQFLQDVLDAFEADAKKEERKHTVQIKGGEVSVLKDGEQTELTIVESAFKKTIKERGKNGTIPVDVHFVDEAVLDLEVEAIAVKDGVITELKVCSIEIGLPKEKEEEALTTTAADESNPEDAEKSLTNDDEVLAEMDDCLRQLEIDMLRY